MNNSNWWATKLGTTAPAAQPRPADIPMPPSQQPMSRFEPPQPQPTSRAQSAQQNAVCPECGSDNYMSVANAAPRCYDCGYPLQQSGSRYGSLTGAKVEGTVKSSRGNDGTNNWNPQGIIGRIDG